MEWKRKEWIMFDQNALRNYIIGSAIVWFGIFIAMAVMLSGTEEFSGMLIVLSGGAVWFVLLVPGWLRTLVSDKEDQGSSDR
jgi:hypothetical protein